MQSKYVKSDCKYHGVADIQNFSSDWCILAEPYACPCEEEGYVCKKYKPYSNDYTMLVPHNVDERGYTDCFRCTECGNCSYTAVRTKGIIDFFYCPYCGREVKTPEE